MYVVCSSPKTMFYINTIKSVVCMSQVLDSLFFFSFRFVKYSNVLKSFRFLVSASSLFVQVKSTSVGHKQHRSSRGFLTAEEKRKRSRFRAALSDAGKVSSSSAHRLCKYVTRTDRHADTQNMQKTTGVERTGTETHPGLQINNARPGINGKLAGMTDVQINGNEIKINGMFAVVFFLLFFCFVKKVIWKLGE